MENERKGEVNGTQVSGLNDWLAGSPIQDRKCCLGGSQRKGDEFGLELLASVFRRSG